jgi:hypothetical protein
MGQPTATSATDAIRKMDPAELLRGAQDLEEVLQHPGFAFLESLIQAEVDGIRRRAALSNSLMLAEQIAKDPLAAVKKLAAAGGEERGMAAFLTYAQRVLAYARSVRTEIESGESQ